MTRIPAHLVAATLCVAALAPAESASADWLPFKVPGTQLRERSDELLPTWAFSLAGIRARILQGPTQVTADLSTFGRLRVYAIVGDLHFVAESSFVRWRVVVSWPRWRPMTNLALLEARMTAGVTAIHGALDEVRHFGGEPMRATSTRLRPFGRPMRMASEALDSLWRAAPGWALGIETRGMVTDPLDLGLEPTVELLATATLIF